MCHGGYPIPAMAVTVARSSVVVGAVWVTLAIASGLYFSFPVFFVALIEEFGWSRGATAAAFSISSVLQGVLSPPVGMLVDRLGPRRVMLGGALVLAVACMLSSRIGSLWSLYIVVGVLAAAGACAVSWVPTGALIARWFAERRTSMMGLAFSGMGAGVLGALLRVHVDAAGRLLGRHPPGRVRGGSRLSAPVRGRDLRAHRPLVGGGTDRLRHRGRPDRPRDLGHHLLRLHRARHALPARSRGVAARGGALRL